MLLLVVVLLSQRRCWFKIVRERLLSGHDLVAALDRFIPSRTFAEEHVEKLLLTGNVANLPSEPTLTLCFPISLACLFFNNDDNDPNVLECG